MSLKFPRSENLKSRTVIKALFDRGGSLTSFPVKLLYMQNENCDSTKAAFAVPKRNFKLAVSRNHVKRQMREAFRCQKQLLTVREKPGFSLLFLYIGKDKGAHEILEKAFKALLQKLENENH
jgi:ribonuclease P protein component